MSPIDFLTFLRIGARNHHPLRLPCLDRHVANGQKRLVGKLCEINLFPVILLKFYRSARRTCIAVYVYLVRLYFYSDDKMNHVEQVLQCIGTSLEQLHEWFYKYFQEGFCTKERQNAVPNVHAFFHLLESRRRSGPLWQTSAEPFEALYAVLRRGYKAGTHNTPKQVMQNFYMRSRWESAGFQIDFLAF